MVVTGGRVLDDGLLWRSCRGVGSPKARRRGGCTQHVFGLGRHGLRRVRRLCRGIMIPGRSRCCCVPAVPAIQGGWLVPRRGVPFGAARVRGRRRGLVPGGGRWAGEALSVTPRCHSSSEWPASAVSHSWDLANGHEPVLRFPRPPTPPVFASVAHIVLLLGAVFGLVVLTSVLGPLETGGIGVPSKRLVARVRAPNAPLGLAVTTRCHSVTVRCHSTVPL